MGYVPKGAPKGKKEKERFRTVEADILTNNGDDVFITMAASKSFQLETYAGATAIYVDDATGKTSILEVDTDEINMDDAADLKVGGMVTTRNAADNSMYVPVAASLANERLWKIAGKVTANDGGYFEALYVNAATSTTATLGRIVGTESKVTINANMDAGASAEALYAKVSVANASEVANAYGLYVEMEETGTGAITAGTGVYVKGGDGAIDYAIDVAQDYRMAAIKLPELAGAAITAATIAGAGAPAQSAAAGDTGFVGLYKDSADSNAISAVFKYAGLYYHVKLTDTTDS